MKLTSGCRGDERVTAWSVKCRVGWTRLGTPSRSESEDDRRPIGSRAVVANTSWPHSYPTLRGICTPPRRSCWPPAYRPTNRQINPNGQFTPRLNLAFEWDFHLTQRKQYYNPSAFLISMFITTESRASCLMFARSCKHRIRLEAVVASVTSVALRALVAFVGNCASDDDVKT